MIQHIKRENILIFKSDDSNHIEVTKSESVKQQKEKS